MLSTIKSKILALTVSVLLALFLLMIGISLLNYHNNKNLIIDGNKYNIENFTNQMNAQMSKLEDNVTDLALLAEFYFKSNDSEHYLNEIVQKDFQNYPHSLGGGIWFRPYMFDPNTRLKAVYAYHDKTGKVVLDPNFESSEYDYPMQRWYLEILPRLSQEKRVVWTTPYFENQGSESLMTTVGSGIYHQGKLIGLATVDWQMSSIIQTISKMKPTPNSFVLFADKTNDSIISSTDTELKNKKIFGLSLSLIPWYSANLEHQKELTYNGKIYIPYVKNLNNGMLLIINIPKEELFASTLSYIKIILTLLLVACCLIAWGAYVILQRNINKPIEKLTAIANKIGQGNLDAKVVLTQPTELADLGRTLNKMTKNLKENLENLARISRAKEKIEAEFSVAHKIQSDALPHQFPLHPSFELYASMTPAKEVGGDFYDFFFVDKTHLAFLMADVSGKGISAALFMMSAKTMIRNILQSGHSLTQVVEKVNKALYDNNSRGMFVTAFICVLNLTTGALEYVNAGHCPPLIKDKKGYHYIKPQANLVLGVMPDFKYKLGFLKLQPNDRVFLYTDGVTEAQNLKRKLYGTNRLMMALNQKINSPKETLKSVYQDVQTFVKGAEPSDDLTMLEVLYYGLKEGEQNFVADLSSWPKVVEFLKSKIKTTSAQMNQIILVAEEIFTNIVKYAYTEQATMRLKIRSTSQLIQLQFCDWGKPYNPLKQKAPDINEKAEKRPIGGLGLFMVKKMTQKQTYEYRAGQNILTIQIKKAKR